MATVTVELRDDAAGNVEATVTFDPPLLPGMNLPAAHRTALRIFRGTALEPAVRAATLAGAQDDLAARGEKGVWL